MFLECEPGTQYRDPDDDVCKASKYFIIFKYYAVAKIPPSAKKIACVAVL